MEAETMEPEAGDLGLEVLATAAPEESHPREALTPEGMPTGACHKCGAKIKDNARVRLCVPCGCRFHIFDCGGRLNIQGVDLADVGVCPRCSGLCACRGGKILCHTAAQKQKRQEKGSTGEKRSKRSSAEAALHPPSDSAVVLFEPSGELGPLGSMMNEQAPLFGAGAPGAADSFTQAALRAAEDALAVLASPGAPGARAGGGVTAAGVGALNAQALAGLLPPTTAGDAAAAQQLLGYYALQAELLVSRQRVAQLEAENAQLRQMLHTSSAAPGTAATAAPPATCAAATATLALTLPTPDATASAQQWQQLLSNVPLAQLPQLLALTRGGN